VLLPAAPAPTQPLLARETLLSSELPAQWLGFASRRSLSTHASEGARAGEERKGKERRGKGEGEGLGEGLGEGEGEGEG